VKDLEKKFPILRGRLLKLGKDHGKQSEQKVSNPWREAIEETAVSSYSLRANVSNPWREAIEDAG